MASQEKHPFVREPEEDTIGSSTIPTSAVGSDISGAINRQRGRSITNEFKTTNEDLKRIIERISRDRKEQLNRIEEKLDTLLARVPPEVLDEEEWVAAYESD